MMDMAGACDKTVYDDSAETANGITVEDEVLNGYDNETLQTEEPSNLFAVGQKWFDRVTLVKNFEKYCSMQNVKLIKSGEGSNTLK